MNDQTVREIIKNGIEANLTPILKSVFDQMKCHNCIHLNKETNECPKTGLTVGEGTLFVNWGCSKFNINEEAFDIEVDYDHITLDQLKQKLGADDHVIYQDQGNMILLSQSDKICTVEFDTLTNKIIELYWTGKYAEVFGKSTRVMKEIKNKIIVG